VTRAVERALGAVPLLTAGASSSLCAALENLLRRGREPRRRAAPARGRVEHVGGLPLSLDRDLSHSGPS
jgi:hypothetical protein